MTSITVDGLKVKLLNIRIDTFPGNNGIVTSGCIGRTPCAVKVIGKNRTAEAELYWAKKLVSDPLPHVVRVNAVGQFEKVNLPVEISRGSTDKTVNTVVVMEKMSMTLREKRQKAYPKTLPEKEWLTIIVDISLAAIELYAEMKAVYTDYRRNNVMCDRLGRWKLIDVASIKTTKGMVLDKVIGFLLRPVTSTLTRESINVRDKTDVKLPRAPESIKTVCENIRKNCRTAKLLAQKQNKSDNKVIEAVVKTYIAGIDDMK
jgi:hypothetical protein